MLQRPVDHTRKQQRALATRRWRARANCGKALYYVEADAETFDLMIRFGGLAESKVHDREAVARALGVLLRRALRALLREP